LKTTNTKNATSTHHFVNLITFATLNRSFFKNTIK
jgi:hypothetical protein